MKNDILTVTVTAVGSEGEGIARREDGYALFIPNTLPGD
ncbi:MAG: TRAM domain-containing protein, partial [Clostridia bacterium]